MELRAIIVGCRHRSVNISIDDIDVVCFSKSLVFSYLAFDGFLSLFVVGISGADDAS